MNRYLLLLLAIATTPRIVDVTSVCDYDGCSEDLRRGSHESDQLLGFIIGDQDFFTGDVEQDLHLDAWLEAGGALNWGRMVMKQRRHIILPWPDAIIPYVVWGDHRTNRIVNKSLSIIQNTTCLRFKPRHEETKYVVIKEGPGGCWTSSVGYPSKDKKVIINLGPGCRFEGKIMHEVLHAAGFVHEHNRPDRADFVEVKWNNVRESAKNNFKPDFRYSTLDVPYDFKSIMHYGRRTFAKIRGQPTLVPRLPVAGALGGSTLSRLDILRINTFYNCL